MIPAWKASAALMVYCKGFRTSRICFTMEDAITSGELLRLFWNKVVIVLPVKEDRIDVKLHMHFGSSS